MQKWGEREREVWEREEKRDRENDRGRDEGHEKEERMRILCGVGDKEE